jgi:hypothetical protein
MSEQFKGWIEVQDNADRPTIMLRGPEADLLLGPMIPGDVRIFLDGKSGDISVGLYVGGVPRNVLKFDADHAALYVGCEGNDGDIIIRDSKGNERIHLDGDTGDIRLSGADCAEEFDIVEMPSIDPGTVLVINDEGRLAPCQESYNKKVAGVVSGAQGYAPGIILDWNHTAGTRLPVSLNGKVYCKADAQYASIEVGDLLTTSPTIGHAMKATDPRKAFGSVIGKALQDLREGQGFIPILVSLQ